RRPGTRRERERPLVRPNGPTSALSRRWREARPGHFRPRYPARLAGSPSGPARSARHPRWVRLRPSVLLQGELTTARLVALADGWRTGPAPGHCPGLSAVSWRLSWAAVPPRAAAGRVPSWGR